MFPAALYVLLRICMLEVTFCICFASSFFFFLFSLNTEDEPEGKILVSLLSCLGSRLDSNRVSGRIGASLFGLFSEREEDGPTHSECGIAGNIYFMLNLSGAGLLPVLSGRNWQNLDTSTVEMFVNFWISTLSLSMHASTVGSTYNNTIYNNILDMAMKKPVTIRFCMDPMQN